jgi:crotonobetainyl-CoA:carnitine CoA-transferase CaiB-like acyl-CoA transferase
VGSSRPSGPEAMTDERSPRTDRSGTDRGSVAGELIDRLLALVGEDPGGSRIEFAGSDPVLPTPFRVGEGGAAVIGASALMAARIWELRGGRSQQVKVAVDAAAAAMRSSRYLRRDPSPEPPPPTGASRLGFYLTRDGRWIYFQRLFPHHQARLVEVLECRYEEDDIARSVARWEGEALEEAVVANGACAGLVRSGDEWMAHEQARAVASLPTIEVTRIASSPKEPFGDGARPLSGVRVLDVTRVLAGPTCGRTLAEHGADVLRVGTDRFPDNELMMMDTGHGKRSCALDLTSPTGSRSLRSLIDGTDVFVQGYRPGALAHLGFSPEDVAAQRPGIVYVTLSAFSHEGPWRHRRGFDSVVQSVNGIADAMAQEGRPRPIPANPLDYATGYLLAFGAMVALHRRAVEGGSFLVRASLAQTGHWLSELPRLDPLPAFAQPPDLSASRLDSLMTSADTPFGRLRYLGPAAELSETPGRWDLPSRPLDHDSPEWGDPRRR